MVTAWKCTAYFGNPDPLENCDSECSWYHKEGCPCAKGSDLWDGKEHYTKRDAMVKFVKSNEGEEDG